MSRDRRVGRSPSLPRPAVLRNQSLHGLAQPYRFHLLNRVYEDYDAMSENEQKHVDALLDRCGMRALREARLTRRIGRSDSREVWR